MWLLCRLDCENYTVDRVCSSHKEAAKNLELSDKYNNMPVYTDDEDGEFIIEEFVVDAKSKYEDNEDEEFATLEHIDTKYEFKIYNI